MKIMIDTEKRKAADAFIPPFQLACEIAILQSPGQMATAREVTDQVTLMFERRVDVAQVHVALVRLEERGLVELKEPVEGRARRYAVSVHGRDIVEETATMLQTILDAKAAINPRTHQETPSHDGKQTKERSRASGAGSKRGHSK